MINSDLFYLYYAYKIMQVQSTGPRSKRVMGAQEQDQAARMTRQRIKESQQVQARKVSKSKVQLQM